MKIRISTTTLPGESRPTHFIDLIDGRDCRNLRSTKDHALAQHMARELATAYGTRVVV